MALCLLVTLTWHEADREAAWLSDWCIGLAFKQYLVQVPLLRSQDLFLGHPKVKSPAMFEPNWLLSARSAGFLNLFLFYLEFLFLVILLFEWSACRQYVA